MNVLVIGGGGREHAILWKLKQSNEIDNLYAVPGNGGIQELAQCIDLNILDNEALTDFAVKNEIDLTFVGPEQPLANGIVNAFEEKNLKIIGPDKKAAVIESSKVFSKKLMKKYRIPTADFQIFCDIKEAVRYLEIKDQYPIVIKADGLAAGKGVVIADNFRSAVQTVEEMLVDKKFGDSGNQIIIEDFLEGNEISILTFTDGKTIIPMISSKDYKKISEGNKGLNTGGMGAIAPNPHYTFEDQKYCMDNIYLPTINAMKAEDKRFKGILYFGLIKTSKGINVLEYNCRFGDPETQAVLPLLETDLYKIFEAIHTETLHKVEIEWKNKNSAAVVAASKGYPLEYKKNIEIFGLDNSFDFPIFLAGVKKENDKFLTNGGRVLAVTSLGESKESALEKAYRNLKRIRFENMYYRKDIGS